ncbi:MAG: iron-containing alcohol dehydrogenase [Verrucomicrobiales bacterium]|nr:iron-containing alcohol dehydrogenase [Verrucomicrobiales bacterium]
MTSIPPGLTELPAFEYAPRTRLVFGAGSVVRVGEFARESGGNRVLLVTDPGLVKVGHAGRIRELLVQAGMSVTTFDRVRENPTTRDVDDCLQIAREHRVDLIVGLGGGSSMDTAKGCNFLLTNGGQMKDYWGVGKATRPMLPLIAIPTTAGTGSECQSAALIADEATHQKMACLDPKAAARVAVLDPELTLSQPPRVTACTGLDALAHAVESAVTTRRNPLSQAYSREAFRLCAGAFDAVLQGPTDVASRGRMLLGAALAGTAIENSMLGAAHAAANPLTAHFNIVHGQAVGMLLPAVVRLNGADPVPAALYRELARSIGLSSVGDLADFLSQALRTAGVPESLAQCGLQEKDLGGLAEEAARQWTARFNPVPVDATSFAELYRAIL